jgi:glycosyltransferase involved in cell wall biosynthesis
VRQLLEALSQLGIRADVLTYPVGCDVHIPGVRIFRAGNPFGVQQVPIGFSLRKIALDCSLTTALWSRLRSERYACIHALEEAAFPAALLGRRAGIPVVYDMQSSLPEQMVTYAAFRTPVAQAVLRAAERWLLRRVDQVVASAGLAGGVRRQAPTVPVREWSYAPTARAAASEDGPGLRRELAIPASAPVVVYSGSFAAYQGLTELLAAAPSVLRGFPNAVFVLVGVHGEQGRQIRRAAERLGAAVRLVERQPRERLPSYLAMADVLVSPRAFGGNLPLKIFDYLAAGKPIVATDIPTHRAVLDETRAVLVEPTAAGLATGLIGVLADPRRAAELATAAVAYADDQLGWNGFVQSVGEVYRSLCGLSASPAASP